MGESLVDVAPLTFSTLAREIARVALVESKGKMTIIANELDAAATHAVSHVHHSSS